MRSRAAAWLAACVLTAAASTPVFAETLLERGRYLVNSIVACGNCHTPLGVNGPLAGMELAGGTRFEEPPFTAYAPNITRDKETGIGRWRDPQIIAAIRDGRRPDGTVIGPPMPIGMYRGISDNDVKAIVAYVKSVTPVKHQVQKSAYRIPLPESYGPKVKDIPYVPKTNKLAYGRYLAGPLGHCVECHTPMGEDGRRDVANRLGAGGFEIHGPWGESVSANITPTGIGRYSDAQLKTMITQGVRPDGSRLKPPMAVSYYARMSDADLDALVAYLRSLPGR